MMNYKNNKLLLIDKVVQLSHQTMKLGITIIYLKSVFTYCVCVCLLFLWLCYLVFGGRQQAIKVNFNIKFIEEFKKLKPSASIHHDLFDYNFYYYNSKLPQLTETINHSIPKEVRSMNKVSLDDASGNSRVIVYRFHLIVISPSNNYHDDNVDHDKLR